MSAMTMTMTTEAKPDPKAPAPVATRRRRRGLSPARQRLAERYLALARSLAKPYKRSCPVAWEEFESAALYALVEAAEAFDPARNIKFGTYARFRILGALSDVKRRAIESSRMRDRTRPIEVPLTPCEQASDLGPGYLLGMEPDPPVGAELEGRELVERWLRRLPARHAATCRQLYLLGRNQAEAAQALGLSQSRLSDLHRAALELLGSQFGPGPRPRNGDGASA